MIKIEPPNPAEGDNITVIAFGDVGPCNIGSSTPSIIVNNNPVFTLRIDCAGISASNPLPPYGQIFQLGTLSAGDYTIIHDVINGVFPVSEQVTFKVTAVKDVPAVSPLGLILLSTILLVMGKRFFKRKS